MVGAAEIQAPVLLAFELTNIACTKTRQAPDRAATIATLLNVGLAMPVRWEQVSYSAVAALAIESGLAPYDAAYLHLAMTLGSPLATFDRDLRASAQGRVPLV